jgi:hypothetical protein
MNISTTFLFKHNYDWKNKWMNEVKEKNHVDIKYYNKLI